jgi:sigma-B regulation protein RsbU (phosphoserine phosphatase)
MQTDAPFIEEIRRLAGEGAHTAALTTRLIEVLAARQDSAVGRELLQTLVLKYAAAEKELYRLHRELVAKQALIDEDLAAAADIQRRLLPRDPAQFEAFDVAWAFEPCTHVGGDIFNVMRLGRDHWAVYALDVSGHGVPAAMVAVSVSQDLQPHSDTVRGRVPSPPTGSFFRSPSEVLQALDGEYPFERFANFFTMVYLVVDVVRRTVAYSNAGHPHPLVVHRDGQVDLLKRGGPVIGLGSLRPRQSPDPAFAEETLRFEAGDKLLLYTDGLIERSSPAGELFGTQRLLALLGGLGATPVAGLVDAVGAAVHEFGGGEPPGDDITLLGIELR